MKKLAKTMLQMIITVVMIIAIGMLFNTTSCAAGVKKEIPRPTYKIYVNRAANCVTVYCKDEKGNYTVPCKAFVCSTGKNIDDTPLGTFKTSDYYDWRLMVDGTYGQYAVRFTGHILFHSVPFYDKIYDTLEWDQYNLLGQAASLGCVRLTTEDAKWIYDNCEKGTEVVVYDDAENPGPLGKPIHSYLCEANPLKSWDPTDPVVINPWTPYMPSIHLTRDMGDGVLYVPVGATMDDVKAAIRVTANTGIDFSPEQYEVNLIGIYDLNTFGAYNVVVQTLDASGLCQSKDMIMAVVYMDQNNETKAEDSITEKTE